VKPIWLVANTPDTQPDSDQWLFSRFARACEQRLGNPGAFMLALAAVIAWAITGPLFHWSQGWLLAINTGTTIVTFLIVFLIQHTQRRDTEAIHLKLDELIRVDRAARNELISLEEKSETEVEEVRSVFVELATAAEAEAADPEAQFAVGEPTSPFRDKSAAPGR
jgi:low affinity Fe/Cu permease